MNQSKFCSRCGTKLPDPLSMDYKAEMLKAASRHYAGTNLSHEERELNGNPPSFQSYPGLTITALIFLVFGFMLMIAGGIGLGSVFLSPTQEAYYQSLPSDAGPLPANTQGPPMNDTSRTIISIASGAGVLIGFFMVTGSEMIKLFIDLQENADRQSIILMSLHKQMMAANRKDEEA